MENQISGRPTQAGVDVSSDNALSISAFFNGVQIISGTLASMPFMFYERIGEYKKKKAINHPLYHCLHDVANPEMTSFVWREISQLHLLLWGNCYSHIIRDKIGRVTQLWPISPKLVSVERDKSKNIYYKLRLPDGGTRSFPAKDIFHIAGLGFDGRVGYSILSLARESLGLGIAMDTFQSRFYGAGTNIGSIFRHPGRLGAEAHKSLVKDLSEKFAGLYKSHNAIVLEEGMEYEKMGMPLADAQFLESKNFQVTDYARWLNISPYKLKDYTHSTFSNIEHLSIDFVQDTIMPWSVRWEQHVIWKLLNDDEKRKYFAEFLITGLLRADTESRNKALAIQRQNGIIDANDWRAIENMNPLIGKAGKIIWMPLNMIDANQPIEEKPKEEPDKVKDKEPDKEKDKVEEKSLYTEERALRAMQSRRKMAIAFKPLFLNMAKEILTKERKGVLRIVKKTLTQRAESDFTYEINKYYDEFKSFVRDKFHGLYIQYGESIYPIAADEVNADSELTAEFQVYINEYADHASNQYTGSSRGQLRSLVLNNKIEEAAQAVEDRLDEWDDKRPEKIASREIIGGETGFAQFVFYAAGFRTVWVATGKSCPYCLSLDGNIISQGMNFLNAGQSFEPEGAESPLVVTSNIGHPPAHAGCDCTLRAGI